MEALNKFVTAWEKTGNIEDILNQNLVLPPLKDVQAYFSTLSEEQHKKIRASLDAAMTALTSHTIKMEQEAAALKEQIGQNIQASNACLVYNNRPRKPRS